MVMLFGFSHRTHQSVGSEPFDETNRSTSLCKDNVVVVDAHACHGLDPQVDRVPSEFRATVRKCPAVTRGVAAQRVSAVSTQAMVTANDEARAAALDVLDAGLTLNSAQRFPLSPIPRQAAGASANVMPV